MKKIIACILMTSVALLSLAACGSSAPSSVTTSSVAGTSAAVESAVPSQTASASTSEASGIDLDAVLTDLSLAANLGGTIKVSEIDLKAGGVNVDNIVTFAGAESQLSAQNGGIVIVIEAVPGKAETVAQEMESYRDFRLGNADYEEFEDARTNTTGARIEVFGDYVVYAVSATGIEGGWDELDAAISTVFA